MSKSTMQHQPSADGSMPLVLTRSGEGIGFITLANPEKRNNLSSETLAELRRALDGFAEDDSVRAIIIDAQGPVFSSGHNMKEFVGADEQSARAVFDMSSALMADLQRLPKPVIAQVAGLASAAGCQLVASCDLVVAATTARFQTPGVMIGLFCSTPMVPLTRAVPPKKAMEMLLTGDMVPAQRAAQIGLVNRVVPAGTERAEAIALAKQIAAKSAYTLKVGKEAFYAQAEMTLSAAYSYASEVMTENMMARDAEEGICAFIDKRPPAWEDK